MLARGGLAAAALLLLIVWLVQDTVRRYGPSERILAACTWLSLGLPVCFIALDQG